MKPELLEILSRDIIGAYMVAVIRGKRPEAATFRMKIVSKEHQRDFDKVVVLVQLAERSTITPEALQDLRADWTDCNGVYDNLNAASRELLDFVPELKVVLPTPV